MVVLICIDDHGAGGRRAPSPRPLKLPRPRHIRRVRRNPLRNKPAAAVAWLSLLWASGTSLSTSLELGRLQRVENTRPMWNDAQLRGYRTSTPDIGQSKPSSNNHHGRMLQPGRRGDPIAEEEEGGDFGTNDVGVGYPEYSPSSTANTEEGGNSYGDYGAYMGSGGNNYNTYGSTSNNAGTSEAGSSSTYGSYGGSSSTWGSANSATGAGSYGGASSYGTSSYGASSYGDSAYGTSSYGGSYGDTAAGDVSGGDTYSSSWGAGAASSGSTWGAGAAPSSTRPSLKNMKNMNFHIPSVNISLIPAVFVLIFFALIGMLITAHKMEHDPEGTFANCCRVSLHTVNCIYKVIFNLYHCRLGEIPVVVMGAELDEDEYTDEEIERMQLRPGIERALDVEHRKALRKVGVEMGKIKVKKKNAGAQSVESIQR
ncbi:hypothetical protein ACHAWF_012586 [Thalassiosira exigua]